MKKFPSLLGDMSFPDIDVGKLKMPPRSPVDLLAEWRRSPEFAHVRAKLFPAESSQPGDLIALLQGAGLEELTGPLTWTFRALESYLPKGGSLRVVKVPVHRVLSHAWRSARIARNFELSAKGTKPPPVDLTEVRFGVEKFYLVTDGNHRCEAAKMRGETFVLGRIEAVAEFNPADLRSVPGGVRLRDGSVRKLPVDLRAAARWLGVKTEKTIG